MSNKIDWDQLMQNFKEMPDDEHGITDGIGYIIAILLDNINDDASIKDIQKHLYIHIHDLKKKILCDKLKDL